MLVDKTKHDEYVMARRSLRSGWDENFDKAHWRKLAMKLHCELFYSPGPKPGDGAQGLREVPHPLGDGHRLARGG